MPTVLMLHTRYLLPGGEDRVFEAEADMLESAGWTVIRGVARNAVPGGIGQQVRMARDTVWSREWARRVRDLCARHRPDVVHVHNTFQAQSPAVLRAARAGGAAVVLTLHNYRLVCPNAVLYRDGGPCEDCVGRRVPWPGVVHACYRGSRPQTAVVAGMLSLHRAIGTWRDGVDVFVALSQFSRDRLIDGGVPRDRIVIKPNFVHPDPGPRTPPGRHCLFVGRLEQFKGLGTLMDAWRALPDVPLRIVGDGPLLGRVTEAAADLGDVRLLGHLPPEGVRELLREARLLVFPSEGYENFPLTVIEAFASGVPVVATGGGAVAELVEGGRTGLIFRAGSSAGLAEKVRRLWDDDELNARMGLAARAVFTERYGLEKNREALEGIYASAVSRRRPAG